LANGQATFRWKDYAHGNQSKVMALGAVEFIRRFLQHVLPKGFQRVRSYGWLSAAATGRWDRILALLDWTPPAPQLIPASPPPLCPHCGGPLQWLATFSRGPP